MAFKKNYKRRKRSMKKYSYVDRLNYYQNKANKSKTAKEQDYAIGYLDGMQGVRGNMAGTKEGEAGNNAGLRFWSKMVKTKIK